MEDIKGPLIKEFVTVAGDYCRLLENASGKRTGELLSELQQLLPLIYLKAAGLPRPKYCYEEEPATFVKEDDYAHIHNAVQQKLDLFNGITGMSPGTLPNQHKLISFGMAERFADLYEELKNFTKLYEVNIPQAMNDAVWICQKSFESSLGITIIDCLQSLHTFIYNKNITGSRAIKSDDFGQAPDDEEPWFSDDQEQVYDDE
jgi:hypothetical protein